MRYIKINKEVILFTILLLLPERILFFVDQALFYRIFHIVYSDFVMIIYIIVAIYTFLHFKTRRFEKYFFSNTIFFIIPLAIMASIVPRFLFGQGIRGAFFIQKNFLMIIFSYYIFRTLIVENVVSADYIWKSLYNLSFAVTGVIIIQHVVSDYVHVLSVGYSRRFGVRITDNFTYSTILLIGSLVLFFSSSIKKEKVIAVIGLVMAFYHCIFVSQTRIVMVSYGVLTILLAIIFRNSALKKMTYLFVLLGLALIVMQSNLGQYFISAVSDTSSDPSAMIREIGKAYYVQEIMKSPLTGRGYPHSDAAYVASGMYDSILLNDNGMFGFAYIYGIVGLCWYVWISIKMFICSFKATKNEDYKFLLYTIFLQVICVNIIWWYWRFSFGLVMSIMLAMMEEYYTDYKKTEVSIFIQ